MRRLSGQFVRASELPEHLCRVRRCRLARRKGADRTHFRRRNPYINSYRPTDCHNASELAGPAPTRLESMTIERIIVSWLGLQLAELRILQAQKDLGWARYWLARQAQADKIYRSAIGSLVLIRDLLPAPASAPAIVDTRAKAPKPEAGDTTELPVSAEILMGNGLGANRIANLVACPGNTQRFTMDDQAGNPPKLNGHHHHRLEDLLANGSIRHTEQGGSR